MPPVSRQQVDTATKVRLTVGEALLDGARSLKAKDFTLEELLIAAWHLYPEQLGLQGYARLHPDVNTAVAAIVGKRGLVARGKLVKLGPKLYRLPFNGPPGAE